jgi:hypothetical protein
MASNHSQREHNEDSRSTGIRQIFHSLGLGKETAERALHHNAGLSKTSKLPKITANAKRSRKTGRFMSQVKAPQKF